MKHNLSQAPKTSPYSTQCINNFFILPWYMNVANTPSLNTGNRTTSWLKHMIRF